MHTNRARHNRFGFTLVELLVVISIIGILMGLLLPAVMSVQGQARQTQCVNNMKNIAFALQNYESSKGCFPGYRNYSTKGAVSWVPVILEELGHGAIRKQWLTKKPVDINSSTGVDSVPHIPELVCPADGRKPSLLSYKVNSGFNVTGKDSLAKDMRFKGLLLNRTSDGTSDNTATKVSLSMISDGASNTLLLAENGHTKLREGWNRCDSDSTFLSRIVYVNAADWGNQEKINKVLDAGDASAKYARPSSRHRGVATIAYADGHVRSMKDTTGYNIYKYIMTPNDTKAETTINSGNVQVP